MSSRRRNKKSQVSVPEDLHCAVQPDLPLRNPGIRARVKALNAEQERYLEAIDNNQLTIGIGPAGTGKTFLSAYKAILHHFIKTNGMKRIIISRPLVEAGGEKMGYLPGDISDKIDPYLRPIYDALYDIIGIEETKSKLEKEVLEIAPLGFMRGRNFKNSFVILDEAQNASLDQLRMIITRIGSNCKMVINGDPSQTDLTGPHSKPSGLMALADIVKDVPGVAVVNFTNASIVRSQIVADLIEAFDKRASGRLESPSIFLDREDTMDSATYSSNRPADIAAVKEYEGIGELVVGGSNATLLTFTALCMLNHPQINQYFLDNNVKFSDRLTKTVIFPRAGMLLPDGEFYKPVEDSKC